LPWIILFIACSVALALFTDFFDTPDDTPVDPGEVPAGNPLVSVTYVYDGDTIQVQTPQGKRDVRFLAIDAPEVSHEGSPTDCGGNEATNALRSILPRGTQVTLVVDPRSDDRDRFGRLLRYVELGDQDVAQLMLEQGFVNAWYPTSSAKPERFDHYQQLANTARQGKVGSWATCEGLGR
jgi:endonuclease YncB( thermonuclease family)